MHFRQNITTVDVIIKRAFRRTYFREIYSIVNDRWSKNSWKEFTVLKNIDEKHYCLIYYELSVNRYGVKCET